MTNTNTTTQQDQNSNLVISLYGSEIAVGIEGTKEQITQQFNRFFNMGGAAPNCTSSFCSEDSDAGDNYIHFLSDRFAYFLSDEEAMIKALETEQLMNMNAKPNPEHKGKRDGILNDIKALAVELYKSIKRENFMLYKTSEQVAFKKLDGGAPSLDMSSLNFFSTHAHVS
jgi:hypothetical protein